jgi:hypothetical protein
MVKLKTKFIRKIYNKIKQNKKLRTIFCFKTKNRKYNLKFLIGELYFLFSNNISFRSYNKNAEHFSDSNLEFTL